MFWKFPFAKWFAPRKNGLYIVKHQGKVKHIGIAFKTETGKNIKQQVKYHYNNEKSKITWMHDNKDMTSIKYIPMENFEEAKTKREAMYEVYKKRVKRYEY